MNQEELKNKLNEIKDKLTSIDELVPNRFYLTCPAENVYDVNKFLFEDVPARFVIATAIDSDHCYEILYHYAYDKTGDFINIKAIINDRDNPQVQSITPFLPGAEWIEREMHDLLGINFTNHPNMKRLILSEDWPEGVYPLRKEAKK
jgi:Ni,Fe-hydrogenase III component G